MKRLLAIAVGLTLLACAPAHAQSQSQTVPVRGHNSLFVDGTLTSDVELLSPSMARFEVRSTFTLSQPTTVVVNASVCTQAAGNACTSRVKTRRIENLSAGPHSLIWRVRVAAGKPIHGASASIYTDNFGSGVGGFTTHRF